MIILLKKDAEQSQVENLLTLLRMKNITPSVSVGQMQTLIGCVGDVAHIDPGLIEALDVVESVQRIQEPYKAANRKFHPEPSVIDCSGVKVGGGHFGVIAGPCSVESEEQVVTIARAVKAAGADMLRGGAFKPRTSPYAFQGLGKQGIEFLMTAKKETGLPVVTELMNFDVIDLFNDVDVIQIGARNMQNFDLLKEVGAHTQKPVLRRVRDGLRQPERNPLRARHPYVRDGDAQHARPRGGADDPQALAPADHRGSLARDGLRAPRGSRLRGGGGHRRGRSHHRGPQRPAAREVRRRAVPDARDVRGDDEKGKCGEGVEAMKDIKEIRKEINGIDEELVRLFRRRLEIVEEVAQSKRERRAPVLDPAREREILYRVAGEVGPEYENGARLLFSTLFGISRARQRAALGGPSKLVDDIRQAADAGGTFPTRTLVACPGTEGAYAQQATSLVFPLPTILYFDGFENVFSAVEKDLCPYGILPIENSAAGSVAPVYDAMVRHRFHIVKALRLRINHVLLVTPGTKMEDIKEISSHPHALAQCGEFLRAHPTWQQVPQTNTAVAAKALGRSRQKNRAVIASRACAELYGLDVLQENISNTAVNYTRFICISKNLEIYPDANKFSIMMSLPHRPGSLNTIISKFAAINVNLTKLESRPVPGMDFEFRFTFDFEASPRDPNVLALLAELAADPEIEHFTFLGAYAEA